MPFDLQPHLRGEHVELRPLREDDWDALHAAASDPLIWEQHPCHDRWREPVFREFFRDALASGGALLALDPQPSPDLGHPRGGAVIGTSRFHGHDPGKREIEIGWTFLVRARWGGVHNGEMKRLMLQHAFRFVDRVIFLVGPNNLRSQRAVEKLGATRVGTRLDRRSGQPHHVYTIDSPTP